MQKKIKVMHFVSGLKNGGVEKVLENYTKKLNGSFPIDDIIVYQHDASSDKLEMMKKMGNTLVEIPYKKTHPLLNLISTYKLIKKEKPDIVHAHMNLLSFFPLMIAKFLGIRVRIAHSHIANDNINPKLAPIFKQLNILFANYYMACGEKAGRYMFGNKKFYILYNAIDQSKYTFSESSRRNLRKRYGIDDKDIVLGTIGRLTKQKNQKFLIDIFQKYNVLHKQSKLMIIGDGELKESLISYAKVKNCYKNIIFIGKTNIPEKYYSVFDYFLLPSLYEGLPVVAIEAQASGINTLLSCNIDKSVKYNDNLLFLPTNNADLWVNAIFSFHNKRSSATDNNYNIDLQFPKLFHFYEKFLQHSAK